MKQKNIKRISINDEQYPMKLKNINMPPTELFYIGDISLLNCASIAIVGSRVCSNYGKMVAIDLAKEYVRKGIVIVSGLARGIDSYAHFGCLELKGKTIAVLGCGVDYVYPEQNRKLYEKIIESGGLVLSEYPVRSKPAQSNFPRRNRIISGLSDGVIVVEAREKSGSLITVNYALEQGKNVYAVPGNIYSPFSIGTNKLLQDGAIPITSIKDEYIYGE